MRPLVIVLAFFLLLALAACQSGPGPSGALEVQPAFGAGVRVFAGPQDGVGVDARLDLGKYGCRTGKAAEPATDAPPTRAVAPSAPPSSESTDAFVAPATSAETRP